MLYLLPTPGREVLEEVFVVGGETHVEGLETAVSFLEVKDHLGADLDITKFDIPQPALVKKHLGTVFRLYKSVAMAFFQPDYFTCFHKLSRLP